MKKIKIIGKMDHTTDGTFESSNRVYSINGLSPAMTTCGGGNLQPKIVSSEPQDFVMDGNNFNMRNKVHPDYGVCRTIIGSGHAGNEPKVLVNTSSKAVGHLEHGTGQHQSNKVYSEEQTSLTVTTIHGGTQQIKAVVAMRGRPSPHKKNEQQLEARTDGLTSTITSVTKDNMLLTREDMEEQKKAYISEDALLYLKETPRTKYRIRKLTPRSCLRLMGVSDIDIDRMIYGHNSEWVGRAAEIESDTLTRIKFRVCDKHKWKQYRRMKRMQKISNSQLYRLSGNSIVCPVLMAIFSQLNIQDVQPWNEMSNDQIEQLIAENR